MTIQVKSQGQAFYFDSLVYTPTLGVVFPSAVLIYLDGDTALNYSSGWKEAGEQVTQTQNAQVTLNFHGELLYSALLTERDQSRFQGHPPL